MSANPRPTLDDQVSALYSRISGIEDHVGQIAQFLGRDPQDPLEPMQPIEVQCSNCESNDLVCAHCGPGCGLKYAKVDYDEQHRWVLIDRLPAELRDLIMNHLSGPR